MATFTRQERQQMRQRGAGTRHISNADFDIHIDGAPANTRQERQLMRQRGAGTRKINDVDFGISFPTPSRTRRSTTRTPQPTPQISRRPSKTPSRTSREPSAARSVRGASASNRRSIRTRRAPNDVAANDETNQPTSPSKRRGVQGKPATPDTGVSGSSDGLSRQSSRVRRRTSGPQIVSIAEELDDSNASLAVKATGLTRVEDIEQPEDHFQEVDADKENTMPGVEQAAIKRRKRKSIGQQSLRRKKRSSTNSLQETQQATTTEITATPVTVDEERRQNQIMPNQVRLSVSPAGSVEPIISTMKKRRKRKSVILKPRKRRSSGQTIRQATATMQVLADVEDGRMNQDDDEATDLEGSVLAPEERIEQTRATENFFVRGSRRRASLLPEIMESPQPDAFMRSEENEDETYIDEDHSPEPPTPAVVEKSRKRTKSDTMLPSIETDDNFSRKRQKSRHPSTLGRKPSDSTFPIQTYRLVNASALPTIMEDAEHANGSSDDIDPSHVNFPDRAAPNAVDVLAQICRETISTTVTKLGENGDLANVRTELKRKRTTLEAFGKELDGRLYEMSAAVENRLTLEGRVRRSKREKADLQARWIEVRRQREEVALKSDAIRKRHWNNEEDGAERHELSERLHDLEMILQREDDEEESLEFMLRSVASRVSGFLGEGLLDRVKEFNGQLERTAAVVEGRSL